MRKRNLIILLLEDDPNDVVLIERAVSQLEGGHKLHSVNDGEEGIRYLRGDGV